VPGDGRGLPCGGHLWIDEIGGSTACFAWGFGNLIDQRVLVVPSADRTGR
jgi:hypothetical protein